LYSFDKDCLPVRLRGLDDHEDKVGAAFNKAVHYLGTRIFRNINVNSYPDAKKLLELLIAFEHTLFAREQPGAILC